MYKVHPEAYQEITSMYFKLQKSNPHNNQEILWEYACRIVKAIQLAETAMIKSKLRIGGC
jgi:hypothetical protein